MYKDDNHKPEMALAVTKFEALCSFQKVTNVLENCRACPELVDVVGEDAVTVQHLDEHETETSRTYGVRLRPPRAVLPQPVGVVFGVEVPKAPAPDAA